jgi:hypothetical protein
VNVLVVNEALGNDASYLARCAPYLDELARRGMRLTVVQYRPYIWQRIPHDVIWWRRVGIEDAEAAKLRDAHERIVYDFDDAVYEMPDDLRRPGQNTDFLRRRFDNISKLAHVVLAGSEYLGKQCQNPHVVTWRTGVPEGAFVDDSRARDGFVWTGSRATLPYLTRTAKAVSAVQERTGKRLVVVCDAPPTGLAAEWIPWKHETQSVPLGRALVGYAPLPHTPYAHGKCGFKIVQYMAAGLAVVASRVPAHEELGALGCELALVEDDDLADKLSELVESPLVARKMGATNRLVAHAHFSTKALLPTLVSALESAAR